MKFFEETKIKKIIKLNLLIILISVIMFMVLLNIQNITYSKKVNNIVDSLITELISKYPDISEKKIIEILSNDNEGKILEKYGYYEENISIKSIKKEMQKNMIINSLFIVIIGVVISITYIIYLNKQSQKLEEINRYLKELNKKNYSLKIEENGEDEFSRFQNELYKTTVLLKETAEKSTQEKEQLSNSLADISHQLKTPLTSIRIMLDNIIDNPEMPDITRKDFISEINKQIEWINSLVISLLKLAKFDAGAIKMCNKEINVKELLNNVVANLSILLEIKNIIVNVEADEKITFIGDYKWQLEAITNIVKNAAEHSKENSQINIQVENTSLFVKIIIKDSGEGISKEDLKHLFERFYKSKNSMETSIGIGLPLSKAIIEKSNGYIKVESIENEGTIFEIKYIK